VDRIEVIRGPGATLWGANAVSGVINIITKNAKDTA
jgi:iron complex outermembrane receptor protein